MIAKKVENDKKSSSKADRATGLAEYITNPELSNAQEKCIYSEAVNFLSDDLKSQTAEMIALSQEAVRSKDPLDHWVLSWKSNELPTPEQAREAAAIFIKHCGLQGHQYITGLHDDTENRHLHIAVNRVHQDTYKVIKINKGFDHEAAHQAIAIIEKVQGWSVEENARYRVNEKAELLIDPATKRPQIFENKDKQQQPGTKAKDMEIQTGQKSAQRIGIENAAPIIAQATSWKELHANMAAAGMHYERKGSGAVIQVGGELVKASDVDRAASLSALQKRFGPYQPPQEIKPNEYHHHTPQPHPSAPGKEPGHGLRNLSKCNLAILTDQGKTRRAGVLHIDARAGGRSTDGLRREARPGRDNRTGLNAPQPMQQGQPGWKEYQSIRDTQKAEKSEATIAQQTRHGAEREALGEKQKAERADIFKGNWKGKGTAKNLLKNLTATKQAAEKLELRERHGEERKELQAQYKPLPMYKQWKEQPQIVSLNVRPVSEQHSERSKQITVAQTLRALSHSIDERRHITYRIGGKAVFRDEGRTIAVLDTKSDRGIAAALAVAQQKYGQTLELTGSDEFKRKAVAVAVANNLTCRFTDPELDKLREQLQQEKYQAGREAARAERDRTAAKNHADTVLPEPGPPLPPSKQPREAVPQTLTTADRADLARAEKQAARTAQREAEDREAAEKHAKTFLPTPTPQAQHTEQEPPARDYLADITQQLEAAQAQADKRGYLHSAPISEATPADYTKHVDAKILASNREFVAVNLAKEIKIYKIAELEKRLVYTGIDTGHGRFAKGNELQIKQGHKTEETLAFVREQREQMKTQAQRERDNDRGR